MSPTLCDADRNKHYDKGELKLLDPMGRGDEPLAQFLAANIVQSKMALFKTVRNGPASSDSESLD